MDLGGAVEMLQEMLSGEEGQQKIQNILQMFGGGDGMPDHPPGQATGGIDPENIEMMFRLQKIMSAMNTPKKSNQTQLLLSLKPFLKESRRKKVDHAMQLLNLSRVMEVLREVEDS